MSILELNNITKTDGDTTVLDGVYFEIEEKGLYAILCKNSSERVALAEVLAGCASIDEGMMVFRGIPVYANDRNSREAKSKIGYVPSETFFFGDMTVFDTLDFTGRMRKVSSNKRVRQIKESLELVNLSSKCEVYVSELSISEKKRLALANALIGNPSMIILDEPTEAVSASDADIIKGLIRMIKDKKLIILLTDKTSLAQEMAMHAGVLANGEITLWDYMENLKERYEGEEDFLSKALDEFSAEA